MICGQRAILTPAKTRHLRSSNHRLFLLIGIFQSSVVAGPYSTFWSSLSESVYSGTSPYDHLTSKKPSPLQSPWLSPKLYSTVQITPGNKVTSTLRSLLPSPVGDINSEVPLYCSLLLQFDDAPRFCKLEICKFILFRTSFCYLLALGLIVYQCLAIVCFALSDSV